METVVVEKLDDSATVNHRHEVILKQTSRNISLNCYVSIILALISVSIAVVVFFVSHSLTADKRAFVATVVSVGDIGVLVILCLARKDPSTLVFFTTLCTFVNGVLFGVAVAFV